MGANQTEPRNEDSCINVNDPGGARELSWDGSVDSSAMPVPSSRPPESHFRRIMAPKAGINKAKNVLLLSTDSVFSLNLIRSAVLAGLRPFVVTDRRLTHDWSSRFGHPRLMLSRQAIEHPDAGMFKTINNWIAEYEIDVVVPADTRCTRLLAKHAGEIRGARVFPLPRPELFEELYDKWQFFQLLESAQVPTPQSLLVYSMNSLPWRWGVPAIVKPTAGEGGIGVRMVTSWAELSEAVRTALETTHSPVLVQEYIPGRDIDLNLLAHNGQTVAACVQRLQADGMHFVRYDEVVDLGRRICEVTGYHGVGHIDMRVDDRDGRVKVIEFNPRFWGTLIYSSWSGMNFLEKGIHLLENPAVAPDIRSQDWFVPHLGFSPRNFLKWARAGFRAPSDLTAHAANAFRVQITDPLPESWYWLKGRLLRGAVARRQQRVAGVRELGPPSIRATRRT